MNGYIVINGYIVGWGIGNFLFYCLGLKGGSLVVYFFEKISVDILVGLDGFLYLDFKVIFF